jgi:DNA invertase Pin-like site-specific DNA recombinase
LIGYARVSTEDQATFSQLDDLRAAGCTVIFEEKASGANRARPELARAVAKVGRGDILVVARIDRLARSLVHLLEVIERVEAVGGHFKSLRDPIDTSTPQGKFALQVLGAAAELERALIRERTRAGLRAARARGRVGGNPGLRRRDPEAIRKLSALRDRQYLAELLSTLDAWMPRVRDAAGEFVGQGGPGAGPARLARSALDGGPVVAGGPPARLGGIGRAGPDRTRAAQAAQGRHPAGHRRHPGRRSGPEPARHRHPPGGDAHPGAARRHELVGLVGQGAARPRRTVRPRHARRPGEWKPTESARRMRPPEEV